MKHQTKLSTLRVAELASPVEGEKPSTEGRKVKTVSKSAKLANVCYDIRGPVLERARQMEEEGQRIMKLNIGNVAAFGLEPPAEIVQDMIRNLPDAAGYTDSRVCSRRAKPSCITARKSRSAA